MSINSIGGGFGATTPSNIKTASQRIQAAIAQLSSGQALTRASDDVAKVALATQLQSGLSDLKQTSTNIAQATSLLQVADGGAEKVQERLKNLNEQATRARSGSLSQADREALNNAFQAGLDDLNSIASRASFNGHKPLEEPTTVSIGGVFGQKNNGGESITTEPLTRAALLGSTKPDLLSADGAAQAQALIATAQSKTTSFRADVGAFQQSLNYAASAIDTARINQEAARSILQDTDIGEQSTLFSLAQLQRDVSISLGAQGNRLSPALLQLVSGS